MGFSAQQKAYISTLAGHTGLNPGVVAAWVAAEEPVGASSGYHGTQNWLNVGITDSGPMGAGNPMWRDPVQAATATANWIKGTWSDPGFGHAAPGIQAIARTAGQSPGAQIRAIQNSGWASGGYSDLGSLYGTYAGQAPKAAAGGASAPMAASSLAPRPPGQSGAQFATTTKNVFDQAGYKQANNSYILGNFISNLDKSNPYDIPVKGEAKFSNPLLSSGVLTTTAPNPKDFVTAQAVLQKISGGTQLALHPQTVAGHASSGLAHPFPGGWQPNRLDMGFDGTFKGNIVAPFNGVVTYAANSFSNWGGYMVVKTADGKNIPGLNTNSLYFAEGIAPTVHSGQQVRAGQPIARGAPSPYGNAYGTTGGGVGQIEWGPAQAGINGQPTDPLAKQYGLGSSGARNMVLGFASWTHRLGIAGPTQTGVAGAA